MSNVSVNEVKSMLDHMDTILDIVKVANLLEIPITKKSLNDLLPYEKSFNRYKDKYNCIESNGSFILWEDPKDESLSKEWPYEAFRFIIGTVEKIKGKNIFFENTVRGRNENLLYRCIITDKMRKWINENFFCYYTNSKLSKRHRNKFFKVVFKAGYNKRIADYMDYNDNIINLLQKVDLNNLIILYITKDIHENEVELICEDINGKEQIIKYDLSRYELSMLGKICGVQAAYINCKRKEPRDINTKHVKSDVNHIEEEQKPTRKGKKFHFNSDQYSMYKPANKEVPFISYSSLVDSYKESTICDNWN